MNGHRYTQSTWKQIAAQPTLQLAAAKVTLVAWWRCIISSKAFVHCCVSKLGPILMNKCIFFFLCRAWVSLQINGVSFVHYSQWPDCLAKQINWKQWAAACLFHKIAKYTNVYNLWSMNLINNNNFRICYKVLFKVESSQCQYLPGPLPSKVIYSNTSLPDFKC